MNFPFLILLVSVIISTILACFFGSKNGSDGAIASGIIGIFLSLGLLVASFIAPLGSSVTKIFPLGQFRLEETPYRVIIWADGKEWVWTDAYTVATVVKEKPVAVKIVYLVNAWGIIYNTTNDPPMESTILFAGDIKK